VARSLQSRPDLPAALTNGIPDCRWKHTTQPVIAGRLVQLEAHEFSRCFAVSRAATRCVLGATWSLRCFDARGTQLWNIPTPGETWAVTITGDGRFCLAAYSDGTIRWHDMQDGHLVVTFFPHADGRRWSLWTPDGLYAASAGGDEFLRWHINAGLSETPWNFPVSRLKQRYYAPETIRSIVSGASKPAARVPAQAPLVPPESRLLPPREGPDNRWTRVLLPWHLRNPSGQPLSAVRVMIDGRPVRDGVWGLDRLPAADGEYQISLSVPPRSCVVSLVVRDARGVWGDVSSVRLEWVGPPVPLKPGRLFLLAIGVSQYADPWLDLAWAHKDAADIAALFSRQRGLYQDVSLTLLTNAAATRQRIFEALTSLGEGARAEDTVLVFFAGHGHGTADGNYYLLPHDVDRLRFEDTALKAGEVRRHIAAIRARVGIFLDACYAGSSAGAWAPPDTDSTANDFSAPECGAAVLASSTGEEQSLELALWQNGLFTSSLVEGMTGTGIVQSGEVTTRMLHAWLERHMPQKIASALRRGAFMQAVENPVGSRGRRSLQVARQVTQTPVLVLPGGVDDFPLIRLAP